MARFELFSAVLLLVVLHEVYGRPTPASRDADPTVQELSSPTDPLDDSLVKHAWDPPFPYVEFGPAIGVDHDEIVGHPKNFDDTFMLYYDKHYHRELRQIACYYESTLVGLAEGYTLPDGSEEVWSHYHGYKPFPESEENRNVWVLEYGAHWSSVQYKICGRKITGINFVTSKGNGVSCGDYTMRKGDGCYANELKPKKGRKIIGLYGDANGTHLTLRKGIRGIGIVTYPLPHSSSK